jgi:hypothetical protein
MSMALSRIGGVMVSKLDSSAVDRGFQPWSGHTKDTALYFNHITQQGWHQDITMPSIYIAQQDWWKINLP